jgi:hypothetical protein
MASEKTVRWMQSTNSLLPSFVAPMRVCSPVCWFESTILLAAARTNPAVVLRDAAATYKVGDRGQRTQGEAGVRSEGENQEGRQTSPHPLTSKQRRQLRFVTNSREGRTSAASPLFCRWLEQAPSSHPDGRSRNPRAPFSAHPTGLSLLRLLTQRRQSMKHPPNFPFTSDSSYRLGNSTISPRRSRLTMFCAALETRSS